MISSSKSVGAVGSETAKHSKHPVALRLFYYTVIAIVGAALLPVIPAAAAKAAPAAPAPQVSSAPSAYTAVNPTRVMDTRTGSGIVGAGNTLGPAASFSLVVAPNATAGVPANATAVVMNVTATDTTAPSYLTVYPTLASLPFASNLNWVAGYTVPNLVTVQPGSGGAVTFYNKFGSVDVIADIAGYYAPPSGSAGGEVGTGFPQRLVDTRTTGGTLGPAATATYQVTGKAGVPATGVSAVIVNATVTNTTAASFLTLWAGAPAARNTVSNANWVAGWTRANRAIVPVSSTGSISVYNQFGSVDVILDVNGYYTDSTASGKLFTSVSPIRLADHTALGPASSFNLSIGGVAGVPTTASAAVLDVVTSETTAPSFLSVSPTPGTAGATSDINWVAGQVNPNLTVTTLGTGGQANFYNSAGNANVSVDLEGYFGAAAGVAVVANPTSIPADSLTMSTITATVTNSSGAAAIGDPVAFNLSGSPAAACGTISPATGVTNSSGQLTATYTASGTVGTCTITATEAQNNTNGSATITQTKVANTVTLGASANPVPANGAATSTITATVKDGVTAAVVSGDTVSFTITASPAGACGSISPTSGTTSAGGTVTTTYTASTTVGFCTIKATESGTGSSASLTITQTSNPPPGTANTVGVVANPTSVPADGKSTSTVTATVLATATPVAGDPVIFTLSGAPAASCGSVSPTSGITNASGVVTTTYTASTTAGTCTVTAREAISNGSGSAPIGQTAVPNKIVVTTSPATLPANGSSASTITATVTNGVTSAAVASDVVTFSKAGNPTAASCGALSGATATTNASGVATLTYTASTTTGFCTITGTDTSTGSGTGTVTQTAAGASSITTAANPASLPADGTSPSIVTATVTATGGGALAGDTVIFTTTGAACGTVSPATATTSGTGKATTTYTASTTVGSCSVTATESNAGLSNSATITQTAVPNKVTVGASASKVAASGAATSTITATVVTGVGATAVVGDTVTFTLSASNTGSCGAVSPTSGSTDATGKVTTTYTSSTTVGFCTITATESGTGASSSTTIDQTSNPPPAAGFTVTELPLAASKPADGTSTVTVTANVKNTGVNVAADPVRFTMTPSVAGACGTLSATTVITDASGNAVTTYTTSTTVGTCTIDATDAVSGGTTGAGTHTVVTQTAVPNNVAVTANPSSIRADGSSTSTITATVTSGVGSTPVSSNVVTFTMSANPAGSCGGLSSATATTNASGQATVTYTASTTVGFCTITATEAGGASNSTVVTQHS